jgi:hypothetical protein
MQVVWDAKLQIQKRVASSSHHNTLTLVLTHLPIQLHTMDDPSGDLAFPPKWCEDEFTRNNWNNFNAMIKNSWMASHPDPATAPVNPLTKEEELTRPPEIQTQHL